MTVTSTAGQTVTIPNVRLGYRRHIDINGGTLKDANDTFFNDALVISLAKAPDLSPTETAKHITNGNLSVIPKLYLDAAGTIGNTSPMTNNDGVRLYDNTNFYLCWIKTPPTVLKDIAGNTVGSDITLAFTDDGIWRNNIKKVSIGSKELVANTEHPDYKITYDSTTNKGSITLDKSLFTVGQKVNVVISSEGYLDAVVTDQIVGHMVTFESNGGDPIPTQVVDTRVAIPVEPTKIGYKFVGWYQDVELTMPFDFADLVTKPTTLYAKYALATSLVSNDTVDNCLGNDISLEFSDSDWAKAIASIKVGVTTLDSKQYKVDLIAKTIVIDKSVFIKTGSFNITISATEYADVTVNQLIINGYNVHFVLQGEAPITIQDQIVARRITEPVVYGYDLTWFADEDCTIPWNFANTIYSAKTIYGKWSLHKFSVVFDHQDGSLVDSKTADYTTTITAPTAPTRAGYTFLGWV